MFAYTNLVLEIIKLLNHSTKICMNINLYIYIFFSEELTEDKDLKNIIFLSKDLIKLSNLCEKKQKAIALK